MLQLSEYDISRAEIEGADGYSLVNVGKEGIWATHTDQSNLMVWGIDGWKGLPQEGTNLAVKIGISEIVKRKIYIR